jgi:large subunit ribosomal protein L10
MKTRKQKQQQIDSLANEFHQAPNVFLLSFEGLSVIKDWEIRGKLRGASDAGIKYYVVKNRLAQKAAEGTPLAQLNDKFKGMTAVAMCPSEPAALAKLLTEFAKENPAFRFKGAVIEGRAIALNQIEALANLPAKPQLMARIMGLVNTQPQRLVNAVNGVIRNLVVVMGQVRDQKAEADGQ